MNPTVNCTWEGSRLHATFENQLKPSPYSRCGKKPHPPDVGSWKHCLPWNWFLIPKKIGDCWTTEQFSCTFQSIKCVKPGSINSTVRDLFYRYTHKYTLSHVKGCITLVFVTTKQENNLNVHHRNWSHKEYVYERNEAETHRSLFVKECVSLLPSM